MFGLSPLLLRVGLLAGAFAAFGWFSYSKGYEAAEAKHNAALLAQIEAGEKLEEARRVVAAERDELAKKLEEEAYADPVVIHRCLSPSRLRRLQTIR